MFSCLLRNNLPAGGVMLFKIGKLTTKRSTLFLFYNGNKKELIGLLKSKPVTSFLYNLNILRLQTTGFSFQKEIYSETYIL